MDLNSESVKKVLSKYKFRDVAIEELNKVSRVHPDMKVISATYTSSDSLQKDLLKLVGNIAVRYHGRSYNLPILLWLLDSFPFAPPICFLRPTSSMVIREGKHVDSKGRIHLPGLHSWDHPKSSVNGLLAEMIAKFEEEPPLGTKSPAQGDNPNDLLAYVSNLSLDEGGNRLDQEVKVSVIGGGDLGIAAVLSIMAKSCVDKLVLIDIPESSTKGGTVDLEIFSLPKVEVSKDLSASVGSKVVVITANAWSDEQSYLSVVQTNVDMYRSIIPRLAQLSPKAVLLVASQPVDIMTHVAWRQSHLLPTQVIGVGCNLDSERLSHIINISLVANNTGKQAWVIGELSENKVALWGNMGPGTDHLQALTPVSNSTKPLMDRALEMLKGRGQRSWSVGLSIADITHSIVTGKKKIHSVTTLAEGWGGIGSKVFLSLPCILGETGSTRLPGVALGSEDEMKLRESVACQVNLFMQLRL
ncbi:ubiquitin-conjugating enzyme E2 variant 3 [Sinocyclocheilus rhinocerous]|uniref:Ubiquitin-conjugating enzyme E2 variant 3 n=2 Tax=Sinocyclocheilus rhinocerous TaxID=307959 RepID=A0A673MUI6_9TELE|nr:PREDICTED: ubiquitin-conjugating enzyme E2 variant 3 [Sinocyclocheilus rhinocerous]